MGKKKMKRVKIKKENEQKNDNKDETTEESEDEWITDEDDEEDDDDIDDDNEKKEALTMKLNALKKEKESEETMQNKLNLLSSSLDNIRSQPLIIDLTKKSRQRNNDLSQQLIGRQMKLRNVRLKYQQIEQNIKRQNIQNEEIKNNEKTEYMKEFESLNQTQIASLEKMGCVLGQIEIPNSSLKSLGYDETHRVMLPSQQFNSLQTSFLF